MFRLVHRLADRLTPRARPIGIDFGSDCLRLAQVAADGDVPRVVAAVSVDVPGHLGDSPAARAAFFAETVRDVIGAFRGREAVLALPAAQTHLRHLRLPKCDARQLKDMLPAECAGKLPIEPLAAVLRHTVAGDVYSGGEAKQEVICVAAERRRVQELLSMAAAAKLDVVGLNTEASALADCFGHIWRRAGDKTDARLFLDIGTAATRCYVLRGGRLLFARTVDVGGRDFDQAAADAAGTDLATARLARRNQAQTPPPTAAPPEGERRATGLAMLDAAANRAAPAPADPLAGPAAKLAAEVALCRRYYESTFPHDPIERLVFVGGEANDQALCQSVARRLGVAAQLGDPMVRLVVTDQASPLAGGRPRPEWAVAVGLSLGPAAPANVLPAKEVA